MEVGNSGPERDGLSKNWGKVTSLPAEKSYKTFPKIQKVSHLAVLIEVEHFRGAADAAVQCVRWGVAVNPVLLALARQLGGEGDDSRLWVPRERAGEIFEKLDAIVLPKPYRGQASGRGKSGLQRYGTFSVTERGKRTILELVAKPEQLALFGEEGDLTIAQAVRTCALLQRNRVPLFERGAPGTFAAAQRALLDVSTVTSVKGTFSELWVSKNNEVARVPLSEVVDLVDADVPIVFDEKAAETTVLACADGKGRAGLRPNQDLFVERYLETQRGMLLALATGQGKTVAAIAALAACWQAGRPVRALVAVPRAVVPQWVAELSAWFPCAQVGNAALLPDGSGPVVVVDSYDRIVSRGGELSAVAWTDFIVDEATLLAGNSKRARGLRALRKSAQRALAITGTPDQTKGGGGILVSWATGELLETSSDLTEGGPYVVSSQQEELIPVTSSIVECGNVGESFYNLCEWTIEPWRELQQIGKSTATLAQRRQASSRSRFELVRRLAVWCRAEADLGSAGVGDSSLKMTTVVNLCRQRRERDSKTVVFCDSRQTSQRLVEALRETGLSANLFAPNECHRGQDVVIVTKMGQKGVNLQFASGAIHYDLPLLGSRSQRIGRIARIGGSATVDEYYVAHNGLPAYLAGRGERDAPGWAAEMASWLLLERPL